MFFFLSQIYEFHKADYNFGFMDIGSIFLNENCKGNEIRKSESFDKNEKLKLLFGKIIQEQYSFFQTKK